MRQKLQRIHDRQRHISGLEVYCLDAIKNFTISRRIFGYFVPVLKCSMMVKNGSFGFLFDESKAIYFLREHSFDFS